jgi:hypothetical protein
MCLLLVGLCGCHNTLRDATLQGLSTAAWRGDGLRAVVGSVAGALAYVAAAHMQRQHQSMTPVW